VQREKLYRLHKTAFFIVARFVFKMDNIFLDQISTLLKDKANEKFLFIFLSPVQIVEHFTLHLASYSIFFSEIILGDKKMKYENSFV
jgi:hypothetical protein